MLKPFSLRLSLLLLRSFPICSTLLYALTFSLLTLVLLRNLTLSLLLQRNLFLFFVIS